MLNFMEKNKMFNTSWLKLKTAERNHKENEKLHSMGVFGDKELQKSKEALRLVHADVFNDAQF